jgi:hypothetical protein
VPTTLFEKTESRSKNGYLVAEHRVIEFRMPEKQSNFEVVFHTAARIVDILADRGAGGRCQIEDDGVIRYVKLSSFMIRRMASIALLAQQVDVHRGRGNWYLSLSVVKTFALQYKAP